MPLFRRVENSVIISLRSGPLCAHAVRDLFFKTPQDSQAFDLAEEERQSRFRRGKTFPQTVEQILILEPGLQEILQSICFHVGGLTQRGREVKKGVVQKRVVSAAARMKVDARHASQTIPDQAVHLVGQPPVTGSEVDGFVGLLNVPVRGKKKAEGRDQRGERQVRNMLGSSATSAVKPVQAETQKNAPEGFPAHGFAEKSFADRLVGEAQRLNGRKPDRADLLLNGLHVIGLVIVAHMQNFRRKGFLIAQDDIIQRAVAFARIMVAGNIHCVHPATFLFQNVAKNGPGQVHV